jgi:ATP-binding cassette subfamily A (ABC1) protein 3
MDEADVLGDRVGVMHTGSLKCLGSPLFLKNRYGAGYDLSLTRDTDHCDDATVLAFVQQHIPSAILKHTQGNDMRIQLPFGQEGLFPDLFTALDDALLQLSVRGYGVAVTTLEQVFLRITEDYDDTLVFVHR